MRARRRVSRAFDPIARGVARFGLTPSAVTLLGLCVAVAGSVLIGFGYLAVGAGVVGFGATLDILDGILARLTRTETRRGGFLDSFTDRVGEVAAWTGLAYYLTEEGKPVLVTLCLVALAGSLLVPFLRAKAEAEGMQGKGGLMGRAERILVFCWGVGLAGVGLPTLTGTVWALAVLTWVTVLQRFYNTWVQLKA
ncbi:MAG TPA: CDP-alcohol phosphatidyltransferase family protein [Acidimicrobiia bacterium]|jgi:CDP-diacylglycerol--glycerol-3-phosphate 3-phosphatidyltransferase|nr:CDP-alcohol phosphatidyltransferase family protein [Acidimicrobiia bacterium]